MNEDLIARLEAATEGSRAYIMEMSIPEPNTGCWLWIGASYKTPGKNHERPLWSDRGKPKLAHRVSYTVFKRTPLPGALICHTCDVSMCVNPDHLYEGTHAQNMADMKERRRYFFARNPESCLLVMRANGKMNNWARGERNGRAKITAAIAAQIRSSRLSERRLASLYGISNRTIGRIRHGETWR